MSQVTTKTVMDSATLAIVLIEPDIPQNTGNIIRLCANVGADLHLVNPSFALEDKKLRRAGLDYHEYANILVHNNWDGCREYFLLRRLIAIETSGSIYYHQFAYTSGDVLVFGSETKGLPQNVLNDIGQQSVKIPMQKGQRSLNLSNCVALVTYEAWRQLGFVGNIG
ncbi:MAG: tRNA (cytidine/uridine-2-O-)-methyltransferase [Pseudomonadota bacterium]|nr:tRNA (cytidine/uridine-2-O-)-methyltransferase [Pseudomonadota bacterium]